MALEAVEEEIPDLVFRDRRLYDSEKGKLWPQSYLVFNVHTTPKVEIPAYNVIEEFADELPDGFTDAFNTAMEGVQGEFIPLANR